MYFSLEFFLTVATLVSGCVYVLLRFMRKRQGRLYWVAEIIASLFVVFLIVLVIRSFVFEPFKIPSGSMLPTLEVGDFILVNKFTYGLRVPVLRYKFLDVDTPERGDVAVFKYPRNPSQDFIKRIIGLPGERVEYRNKTVYINGAEAMQSLQHSDSYGRKHKSEDLTSAVHAIFVQDSKPAVDGVWRVPEGHYLVMGDNRDNSNDSRSWGFVPQENLVGRAFIVWMHWNWDEGGINFSRIGGSIE